MSLFAGGLADRVISGILKSFAAAFQRLFVPRVLTIWLLAALAGTIMGPFGTYSGLDWGQRGVFWGLISASSVFLSTFIRSLRRHIWGEISDTLREILHVTVLTLCLSPLVYGLAVYYRVEAASGANGYLRVLLFVMLLCGPLSALRRINHNEELLSRDSPKEVQQMSYDPLGMMGDAANEPHDPEVSTDGDCRLMARMPTGTTGPILHLAARDHFVDVELDGALVSLRMSFSDAVAEMDAVPGFITHGAHWVAEAAIVSLSKKDGQLAVLLKNGRSVPVSRYARPKLEEAGILAQFDASA